jgi:hypothetical protein
MSDNNKCPLLSIVLPTYNRANVLDKALRWMRPQTEPFGDAIEVIISNNHSTDDTPNVLKQIEGWSQARIVQPHQHVPPHEHFLWLGTELPRAEYCWMLGDDDFPLKEGLARVLSAISAPETADYILINVAVLFLDSWLEMSAGRSEVLMSELWQARITPFDQDRSSPHLRDILECGGGDIFIACGIPAHIFKPAVWRARIAELDLMHTSNDGRFTNLDNTFPHLTILYACEGHCRFQFIHEACAVQSCGAQEWAADQLKLLTNAHPYILAQYQRLGVSEAYIDRTWLHFMSHQWKTVIGFFSKNRSLPELIRCLRIINRSHPSMNGKLRSVCALLPYLAISFYGLMPEPLKNVWRRMKPSEANA